MFEISVEKRLLQNIEETLNWMLKQLKWNHRQQLGQEDENLYPDSSINWSPEMSKAMCIQKELEKITNFEGVENVDIKPQQK